MNDTLLVGLDFDPYEVLGASTDSTPKDLKMAFRKKALEFHPDKNPQRKDWAEKMFLKISKAFEILSDEGAKGAFDRLLKAKAAAKARTRNLDSKRRKLKEDLEAREAGARSQAEEESAAMRTLEREIERLRKQGSAMLRKEKEEVEREVHANVQAQQSAAAAAHTTRTPPRLKAKWGVKDTYDRASLLTLFEAYGPVTELVLSGKKKGAALIEFADADAAGRAQAREKGIEGDPLDLSWVSGQPSAGPSEAAPPPTEEKPWPGPMPTFRSQPRPSAAPVNDLPSRPAGFEDLILRRMMEAQQRKNLAEQEAKQEL